MRKNTLICLTISVLIFAGTELFAISVAERSHKDYTFTTMTLRQIKPMIKNFSQDGTDKELDEIIQKFEDATLEHYARNFDSSAEKYYNLKLSIMNLLEKVANQYIARTKELLQSTTKENKSIEIFIDLSRNNGYASYFKKPFDPLKDVKPYNENFKPQDYNYYFYAGKIERYLKNAYFHYQEARKAMKDPVIPYLKRKKKIKTDGINYIINRYLDAITLCRIAKESGLEIYRVRNEHNTGLILEKYDIRKSQITPIFDDRIPEKYKVDAVDNKKLLYGIEVERRKKALDKK